MKTSLMMKLALMAAATAVVLLLPMTITDAGAYSGPAGVRGDSPSLEQISESIYVVRSETTFKRVLDDGTERMDTRASQGIAAALDRDLLLTADHVVSVYGLEFDTPFGTFNVPGAERVSERIWAEVDGREYPLRVAMRDAEMDVIFLKLERAEGFQFRPLPIAVGDSTELRLGTEVWILGSPFNLGLRVNRGVVSSLKLPVVLSQQDRSVVLLNSFMLTAGMLPGDSGGLVLVVHRGRFAVVGIMHSIIGGTTLGGALRFDVVAEEFGLYWMVSKEDEVEDSISSFVEGWNG